MLTLGSLIAACAQAETAGKGRELQLKEYECVGLYLLITRIAPSMQRLLVSYKSLKEASLFLQLLRSKPSLRTSLLLLLHLEPGEPPCEGLEFLLELRNLCPLVLLRLDVLVKDLVGVGWKEGRG